MVDFTTGLVLSQGCTVAFSGKSSEERLYCGNLAHVYGSEGAVVRAEPGYMLIVGVLTQGLAHLPCRAGGMAVDGIHEGIIGLEWPQMRGGEAMA